MAIKKDKAPAKPEAAPETEKQKVCFVIAPIGEDGSPTRLRSDKVLKHLLRKTLEPMHYRVLRADQIGEPGLITAQIFTHLAQDDLVVADLTGHNGNVMYELAVRHLLRLPYIQVIDSSDRLPFDIAAARTIFFNLDPDSLESAQEELAEQVRALESGTIAIESPLSQTIAIQALSLRFNPAGCGGASGVAGMGLIPAVTRRI